MANISAIKLPDGVTYDIVDRVSKNVWYGTSVTSPSAYTKVVTTTSGDFGGNIGDVLIVMFDEGLNSVDGIDLVIDGTDYTIENASPSYIQGLLYGTTTAVTFVVTDDEGYTVSMADNYIGLYADYLDTKKQDELVSGTNIKTINNQSILGSGNIDTKAPVIFDYDIDNPTTPSHTAISNAVHSGKRCYVRVYSSSDVYEDETFLPLVSLSSEHYAFFAVTSTTGSYRALTCNISVLSPAVYTTGSLQQNLVSGTNIKTINGNSILGSGDLTVTGGTQVQIVRW